MHQSENIQTLCCIVDMSIIEIGGPLKPYVSATAVQHQFVSHYKLTSYNANRETKGETVVSPSTATRPNFSQSQ